MEDNNFFGFVSKIGSLITNNKPKENKKIKPIQKKYNIKISTEVENEKEIDNIDNQDDEEEEEEDDEDKKETEEEKKIREEKEKIEKEEKNKIQNMVLDILKDSDKKNEEKNIKDYSNEEKINEDNENNINNNIDNINNEQEINKDEINSNENNIPKIVNNSFPFSNNNNVNDAFVYDEYSSCHIMLKKGNDININDYTIFPILFMEKQKNLFYKIGMINTPSYEQKKYLFFFDEHYLYFAKDEIIPEEMYEYKRRITKIVSLFDIKDFSNDHNGDQFIIKLTVKKEMKEEKIIHFYIDQKYFAGFIKNFNLKLSIYGIDFFHFEQF